MMEIFLGNPLYKMMGAIFVVLIAATFIVFLMRRHDEEGKHRELSDRVKSWWFMIAIFFGAMLLSPMVSVVFFALLSFLAFKEYISIIPLRQADRGMLFLAYLTIPIQYYLVGTQWYGMFVVFIPVWVFFLLPVRLTLTGKTSGFLQSVSAINWGLMITVFAISHAAMLLQFPSTASHVAGGAGLLLFLSIINQGNDVAQYVWGKILGKHKIVPEVSPKKTWEGFLGGVVTSGLAALILSPFLTPFEPLAAAGIGAAIAVTGFIGYNFLCIKTRCGS